jgi:tetratricopeptide (TPR) repeat protein
MPLGPHRQGPAPGPARPRPDPACTLVCILACILALASPAPAGEALTVAAGADQGRPAGPGGPFPPGAGELHLFAPAGLAQAGELVLARWYHLGPAGERLAAVTAGRAPAGAPLHLAQAGPAGGAWPLGDWRVELRAGGARLAAAEFRVERPAAAQADRPAELPLPPFSRPEPAESPQAATQAQPRVPAEERARELVAQGERLLQAGRPRAAARAFREALQAWPQAPGAVEGLLAARRASPPDRPAPAPAPSSSEAGGPSDRQRRRQARLDYTQALDQFNAGEYQRAVELFRRYLAVFPEDGQARRHLELAREMERGQRFGSLVIHSDPQAVAYLDGRRLGATPLELAEVPVGPHLVEVRAPDGVRSRKRLVIKGRTKTTISFAPRLVEAPGQ